MTAIVTSLALVLLIHICAATLVMRRQARQVCGWRMQVASTFLGQACVTLAAFVVAVLVNAVVGEFDVTDSVALYIVGGFVMLAAWGLGLNSLTNWMAQNARGSFYSAATVHRVTGHTFVHLLSWYGAAAILGFAGWHIYGFNPGQRQEYAGSATAAPLAADPAPTRPPANAANPSQVASVTTANLGDATRTSPATSVALPAAAPVRPVRQPGADRSAELAVLDALGAWATAWSRRDVDAYLAAYAQDFHPPDGLTRQAWEAQRRQRIAAARFIAVSIENDEVSFTSPDNATVNLRQSYKSNLISTMDRKSMRMVREGNQWRILEERNAQ